MARYSHMYTNKEMFINISQNYNPNIYTSNVSLKS